MKISKPVYLSLPILDVSKIAMYDYLFYYTEPKYGDWVKLCHMDTDSFMVPVKSDNVYANVSEVVETRFDTLKFDVRDQSP